MIKEITNLLLPIIFYLLPMTTFAQRDWELTEQRNQWLTSGNAAALVTFADSSISKASVSYGYEGGTYRGISDGKDEMTVTADARSYYRLSRRVMSYGSVTYTNFSGTEMSGSMTSPNPSKGGGNVYEVCFLKPFDILQSSDDAGRKHLELFNVVGAVGWDIADGLSVGAKADFSAGNYSKYKDLRHANTLMNLSTKASVLYLFGSRASKGSKDSKGTSGSRGSGSYGIGASFLYNRSTETVRYKTYGTTDHIYHVLLDYANQQGETLTFGGDGFIDDNTELPLFDERCGFSVQTSWMADTGDKTFKNSPSLGRAGVGLSFTYLHRHGYYGRQSQYTASYEQHSGNSYGWQLRVNMPQTRNTLSWLDFHFNSEGLTSNKTNYRQVKSVDNSSVTYYEYYAPTKMADKLFNSGSLAYTLYLKPHNTSHHTAQDISQKPLPSGLLSLEDEGVGGSKKTIESGGGCPIYLWQFNIGTHYLYTKQTAYLYPDMNTRKATLWMPFVQGRRNIILRNTSVLGIQLGLSANCGDMDIMMDGIGKQVKESIAISYELPLFSIRSNISLRYSCMESTDASYSGCCRHNLLLSLGAMF